VLSAPPLTDQVQEGVVPKWELLGTKTYNGMEPLLGRNDIPTELSAKYENGQGRFTGTKQSGTKVILGAERGHFGTALIWKVAHSAELNARFIIQPLFEGHERNHALLLYKDDGLYDPQRDNQYTGTLLASVRFSPRPATLTPLDIVCDESFADIRLNDFSILKKPISVDGAGSFLLVFAATARWPGDEVDTSFSLGTRPENLSLARQVRLEPDSSRWVSLFNGKDFKGWKLAKGDPKTEWSIIDGVLSGLRPESRLFSERGDYANFHFRMEAKVADKACGAQWFRAQFDGNPTSPGVDGYCTQSQVTAFDWDRTGSLFLSRRNSRFGVGCFLLKDKLHKPGEWFSQEVIAKGNHIVVRLNGRTVVDYIDPHGKFTKGHFVLGAGQTGAPLLHYRNIESKELPLVEQP
jgi:hypothetical protein